MKSYQFQFSPNAERFFISLHYNLQKRILEKLAFFEKSKNPLHLAKKMQGYENTYRFRIGDYRVIVTQKDKGVIVILLILKIGHRREVYE